MDFNSWFILIVVLLFVVIMAVLVYSGLTANIYVRAQKSPFGTLDIAYKPHWGPYSNVGRLFMECCKMAPNNTPIGIYLDNPRTTPANQCRSAIGVVLQAHDKEIKQKMVEHDYTFMTLPSSNQIVYTTFPYVNYVSMYIGIWRVYPAISKFLHSQKLVAHPFIELYTENLIHYLAPLSDNDNFIPQLLLRKVESLKEPAEQVTVKVEHHEVIEATISTQESVQSMPQITSQSHESNLQPEESTIEETTMKEERKHHKMMENTSNIEENVVESDTLCNTNDSNNEGKTQVKEEDHSATDFKIKENEKDANADDVELAEFEAKLAKLEQELTNRTSRNHDENESPVANTDPIAEIEEHLKRSGHSLDNETTQQSNTSCDDAATTQKLQMSDCEDKKVIDTTGDSEIQTDDNKNQTYEELAEDIVKTVVNDAKKVIIEGQADVETCRSDSLDAQ